MKAVSSREIWVGPAGSGKTSAALAAYGEALLQQGVTPCRQALWLAPSYAAAAGVRERLLDEVSRAAAWRARAILDPGATSFAGLAEQILRDVGRLERELTPAQRRQLLRTVVAEATGAGALKFFRTAGGSASVVNQLDEAIVQAKRHDLSPKAFARRVRRGEPRQRDLAELYQLYEARLRQSPACDAEGLLIAARDALRAADQIGTALQLVVVDGFSEFTIVQQQIIALLGGRARRTIVTLVGEESSADGRPPASHRADLFAIPAATSQALEEAGFRTTGFPRRECQRTAEATSAGRSAALVHLERNIFRNYRDVEPATTAVQKSLGCVQVIAASSTQAEIEEIARRVKRLLIAGTSPCDVVVAFRSTHDVADRVRRACEDFGIPLYIDARPRLAATAAVRSLTNLLRSQAEDWPYRRLLAVIGDRSLALDGGNGGAAVWPADGRPSIDVRTAAELCVRHAQLPSGRAELLDLVESWAGGDGAATPVEPEVAKAAAGVLTRIARWFHGQPEKARLSAWIENFQWMAGAALKHGETLGGASPPGPPQAEGVGAVECEDLAALVRLLRETAAVEYISDEKGADLDFEQFVELVANVADEARAPQACDAAGRVRVLSAESARLACPRHLFIGGLSEQAFSVGEPLGDPRAASDGETNDDATADETLRVAKAQPGGAGMLLFYQLATQAGESLTLSYPALDGKAQPMPPSPLLVELERAFGDTPVPRTVQSLGYAHRLEGPPLSKSDLRRSAVQRAEARDRTLLAALLRAPRYERLGHSIVDGIDAVASRGDRRRFGAHDGVFFSDEARAILERRFGSDCLWSPSLLETYASCPFQFFSRQVLRLAPPPELALESDLARRGSLLHDTLARLYARLAEQAEPGAAPPPEEIAEQFQRTLDAVVHARPARGLQRALREIERRQIASWAAQFAQQHSEYAAAWQHLDVPLAARHFEARFGPKNRRSESDDDLRLSTDKPFELEVGSEKLRFAGQIDRIDMGRIGAQTVFNVVDYKTSANAKVNREQMAAGTQLQLPLYALAAAELLLADTQAVPLAAGYWSIRGKGFAAGARAGGPLMIGEIKGDRVQLAASWTELRQTLLERIAEIVTGIRRGWFPVYSEDKNCTQYCEFSTTCRIAHVRSLEKSWQPPVEEG